MFSLIREGEWGVLKFVRNLMGSTLNIAFCFETKSVFLFKKRQSFFLLTKANLKKKLRKKRIIFVFLFF